MEKEFKGTRDWKLGSSKNNEEFKKVVKTDMDVIAIDVDGHPGHIMLFGNNDKEHKANAKLALAAPKLLEACIMTLMVVKELQEHQEGWHEEKSFLEALINKALN
jgi:hypothetical protein